MTIRTEIIGAAARAAIGLLLDRLLTAGVQFSVEPVPNRMHPDVLPGWVVAWPEPAEAKEQEAA
jgi:hypothetical protein